AREAHRLIRECRHGSSSRTPEGDTRRCLREPGWGTWRGRRRRGGGHQPRLAGGGEEAAGQEPQQEVIGDVPAARRGVSHSAWTAHANTRDCTCAFEKCRACGVIKKLSRCVFHEEHTQDKRGGREYFESMQVFVDGIPQNTTYAIELGTALEEMNAPEFRPGSS